MLSRRFVRLMGKTALSALGASALLLIGQDAHASGYLTARFGADHGTPATPNPYAVYFNPAAMGGTRGTNIVVDASILLRHATYERGDNALSPDPNNPNKTNADYVNANTGKGSLTNVLALPYIGGTTDLGTKDFRLGLAGYIPYGGMATWSKKGGVAGVPGSTDGPQRWHNIAGTILAMHGTLAASYTIQPINLSIGASVSGIYHTVSTVRARNADDSDDILGPDGSLKEGRSYLTAHGFNVGTTFGLYMEPAAEKLNHRLKLGLSYISQPGFGETRMNGELTQQLGTASVATATQKIDFLQSYPDIIRFGAAYKLPNEKWEIKGDFEFVRWSVFDRQCVVLEGKKCDINADGSAVSDAASRDIVLNLKRDWQNAIGARLGPSYFVSPELELFGSLGITTSAVPKKTIDASTIDSFRVYATLGARYELTKHVALAGSYNHIFFVPVDTAGTSVYAVNKVPSRSPSADGKYNSTIGFLNVNATFMF